MVPLIIALLAIAALYLFGIGASTVSSGLPTAPSPQIQAFAMAIAKAENSPADWNNPGSLTISFGYPTVGTANSAGVLKFQNVSDGWNALYKQLLAIVNGNSRYSLSDTLAVLGMGYSGGDPNWAVNVANFLGVTPDTELGDVLA